MQITRGRQVILPENAKTMIRELEAMIHSGKLLQGDRIPPIRQLMKQYDVSLGSAKRALDVLQEKKLLETRPGAGTFVKSVPSYSYENAQLTIMVFLEWNIEQGGIYSSVFEGVRDCAMGDGCSLLFSYLGNDRFSVAEVEKLAGDADGVIFLSEYDRGIDDFRLNIPAVGVGWHASMNGCVSVIDLDPFDAADLAVDYFRGKEADKVTIVTVPYPNMLLRADSFTKAWERAGGKVETIICGDRDFETLNLDPNQAYLFTSSWGMESSVASYREKTGRNLLEEATVLSVDGRNLLMPQGIKADSVMPNWQEVGRRAFHECISRIKQPGRCPARLYLPCSLTCES